MSGETSATINLRCKNLELRMSALGQKQTSDWQPLMSALPPKADIAGRQWNVRFVPLADTIETTKTSSGLDVHH
jgi:hypothetical protein